MRSAVAVALSGAIGLVAAHPQLERRAIDKYPAGMTWDIVLDKSDVDLKNLAKTAAASVSAIDIDMFDNDASTISTLKKQGKKVICYFSAGSREDWRDDAKSFTSKDYGQALDGWEGENWVNVKSQNVKNIMANRIKLAASKGCDAVDPDNTDGFNPSEEGAPPQDGYNYDEQAYVDYFLFLAGKAAENKMAIGLKNSISLIPKVISVIQFAVNEQCHEYNECQDYLPLTKADKAVFSINYGSEDCTSPGGTKLSILNKPEHQQLNVTGGACTPDGKTTGASLTSVDEEPAVEEATPAVEEATPVVGEATPAVGEATPAVEEATPTPETGDEDEENNGEEGEGEEEEDEEYDDEEDEDEDEDEDEEEGSWWSHRHD